MTEQTGSASFPPTRAEAQRRLMAFVPRAGAAYATGRNADLGPGRREAVSNLSPYLRYRLITEREVIAAVHDRHSPRAAEKFVQEVLWRTYWKGWLEARPATWIRFEAERDVVRDGLSGGLAKAVQAAETGMTGIEGFDDWALELVETGYLHNHARMWFASIWIFTLRLPWVLGADFFLRHLIDADPASNTLSWRWVAGLQTRGKTYLATTENIERYTDGRFAPHGLAREAHALSEPPLPSARPLEALSPGRIGATALLLMTPEDLDPSSLVLANAKIGGILAITGAEGWPWGEAAQVFVRAAVDDAANRASASFNAPSTIIAGFDAAAILAAAEQTGASEIITSEAPVGPIADALARLGPRLAAAGISMVRCRRAWDERFWPHATKGFFAFRERIGDILAAEGLPT
jgi:deoxyribodipyrimidine photo-lyase